MLKYRPEFCEQAKNYALLGATDDQMAAFFGVSRSNFAEWKNRYPGFGQALREGKDIADAKVAAALYHRAIGYSHPETDIRVISGRIVKTEIVKHYPPDTLAINSWLNNRQPALWRSRHEITGKDGGPLEVIAEQDQIASARAIAFALTQADRAIQKAAKADPAEADHGDKRKARVR